MASALEILVKTGAITSTGGVALLVVFVAVLLVFPVVKECDVGIEGASEGVDENCVFESTAPEPLRSIVSPGFLAASLLVIAAGIVMIRYSRWRESRTARRT